MSTEIKDAPGVDAVTLESLDFEPDCEANWHAEKGAGRVVAIMDMKLPCCGHEYSTYICVGCLAYALMLTTTGLHRNCGGAWKPHNECIKDVHYL